MIVTAVTAKPFRNQ